MSEEKTKQTYIVKIEKDTEYPILFFPDAWGCRNGLLLIGHYAVVGEHGEASKDYMIKSCYFPKTSIDRAKCNQLVDWYGRRYSCEMIPRKRVNWRKV